MKSFLIRYNFRKESGETGTSKKDLRETSAEEHFIVMKQPHLKELIFQVE